MVIDAELEKKEIIGRYRRLLRKAKPILKRWRCQTDQKSFYDFAWRRTRICAANRVSLLFFILSLSLKFASKKSAWVQPPSLQHSCTMSWKTPTSNWPISSRMFGKKITRIIDGLTKIRGVFEYGTSQQAENFRKMLFTLSEDVRVILIKLADRLHNMRTLDSMPRNKQLKVANETIYLYAPLAHRLGLNAIKTELGRSLSALYRPTAFMMPSHAISMQLAQPGQNSSSSSWFRSRMNWIS